MSYALDNRLCHISATDETNHVFITFFFNPKTAVANKKGWT
jgi:hypothetical protein